MGLPLKTDTLHLMICSKLSSESQQIFESNQNMTASMELLTKFIDGVQSEQDNDIKNAFRVTMRCNNLSETTLPFILKTLIKKANGKTLAIKDKGTYSMDTESKCFVIDIDGNKLSKQILSLWNKAQTSLDSMLLDIAFYVGSKEIGDYEEQILLCTQINKLSVDHLSD